MYFDPLLAHKLLLILGSSFIVCAGIVLTQRWHGKHSLDHDLTGAQKLHSAPVPRVGGLALLLSLCMAVLLGYITSGKTYPTIITLLVCALPVFLAGLMEDLTKRVSVRARFLASFISAGLAVWLVGAQLTRVHTPGLDLLLQIPLVSVLFTVFAVGGVTHSVNIIDGLNGLAAGSVSLMLAGLATLAWIHGDTITMNLCLCGIAALGGFMLLNFPFGKIFLGDGGAYLAGFWLAECAVLLLVRNPEVSTWTVLLCCLYPVLETGYSMYRRHVVHKVPSGAPDMGHMHQLLYKWFKEYVPTKSAPHWLSHGVTSVKIWLIVAVCQLIAALTSAHSGVHIAAVLLTTVLYVWIHRALWAADEPPENSEPTPSAQFF